MRPKVGIVHVTWTALKIELIKFYPENDIKSTPYYIY